MKAIIQKSGPARVEVNEKIIGKINSGFVILLGVTHDDTKKDAEFLVEKIINLRLLPTEEKHFDKSLLETDQEALVISQFTLYAGLNKGRRPDFTEAAKPETAKPLYEHFISQLKAHGIKVETGEFGAMMNVHLVNEGPITIILDSTK